MPGLTAYTEIEESLYIGIIISAVFYGLYCGVVYLSISAAFSNAGFTRWWRVIYVSYGIIQWLLNTMFFLCLPLGGQIVGIVNRNKHFSGPPEDYLLQYYSSSYGLLGNAAQNLAILLSDFLLIYRCYVILGSSLWIVIPPTLSSIATFAVFTATIPLSLLVPSGDQHISDVYNDINSAGIALATFTNVTTTAMISFRILTVLHSVRRSVDSQRLNIYTSTVAILVESAAPCALISIIFAVTLAVQTTGKDTSVWGYGLFPIWGIFLAFFPQLIILRIAQGNAWTRTTSEELTRATITIALTTCMNVDATMAEISSDIEGFHVDSSQYSATAGIDNNRIMNFEQGAINSI